MVFWASWAVCLPALLMQIPWFVACSRRADPMSEQAIAPPLRYTRHAGTLARFLRRPQLSLPLCAAVAL
eukprot:8780808-Pyramimonas_sp.AAC.1